MSRNTKSNIHNSKVIGIQFSILSPDEIRKGSVAEITSRDTYVNNKPIIGGLFDPRMGVLEPGLICPTDGLDYMQTPGYFGHIELARPVFYIQYLSTIFKVLRCVCFKCSKLMISKEKYKQALKMAGEARWKYVFALASKMKRCGEDTEDGCGCLQPNKIRKDGLATIYAEWKNDSGEEGANNIVIKLTPEMVLKIFKRISDEDVSFMGFSPVWSRPDWMICQVMAVPPPAVRPSVKHDAQQRSEDDLSHILVNIIKTNKTLQEKLHNNAPANVIDDWTTVLQYYVATQVDNKIPGVASVAQRSGRPLKSIKDRLNGKGGRMRGNLMAKRVDFSARSVITADPNISIRELGIPMKIAKNITKPVVVNAVNRAFLMKLVQNGPDVHPGAKILEKKNGDSITLRYIDRKSIVLEDGDIVHRHMMDGDAILFNRQPTLHRMSMMCHIARIMKRGDTFRMNVADTKPYNADFDGDEMNLHMPQDAEAESELRNLAAVPYQIISPANNSPIIGIYQDSMLGCNRFTRENIRFTPREAMNILMMFQRVNEKALTDIIEQRGVVTNFELMSQILPPLSLKYNTKLFKDGEDKSKSNNVLEIKDGQYLRGQMEKGVLGGGTKGLIQRICNDFGNFASANFIDDLQNIITEYMKSSAYSVGISDLIADEKTNQDIIKIITDKKMDVKKLIDQTQIGVFENKTGKTNEEEFETQVNNILNQASSEAGKIGLTSLSKDNRFVIMVSAGSKGSDLNISQMISCLGQQNVDGKRIPYGFDHRTLPHFTKYDDSPSARGFVESSYINGLNPQELFFHAMGGRVGLIDTAVKTSTTGYIQRRLIKGLEDLMVSYDMTVRTNKGKLVQFAYGDDGIDPVKVENQSMPLVSMSIQDIYAHYNIPDESGKTKALSSVFLKPTLARYKKQMKDTQEKCKFYTDLMIQNRDLIVKNVFKNKSDSVVNCPVAFSYIINNVIGQQNINASSVTDLTPLEAFDMIEKCYSNLEKIRCAVPTALFKTLYFYYLSPKDLLFVKRFNKVALTVLLENVAVNYKRAIVAPGEMVGMVAAQSIGEPTTQMSALKCEHIRCVKINKITKEISMVSGEIGPMCDALIEQYPQYTFATGHVDSVETILDGATDEYYIIGVDTEEKTHWNKISHVSRHPVNGNVMKVTTKSGRIVSTTTSHSHLVRDEKTQTVVPITGANMKEGMRIPVAKHIDNTFVKDSVTIGTTVQKLDHLFGWFIGAYLAEGNLNKKTGTQDVSGSINITNISNHFIENTKKFATQLGKDCRVVERECEYGPSVITSFSCKPLADFLLATCDNGSFVKRVPDFAFLAPNEFKAGLIQAYFDGDGNFQCDEGHHQIRVCSRSKQLTKDMALMLNYFDIFGSIKENFTRGSNIYNLAISAKYSRQYQESIGSQVHGDKLQALVDYIDRDSAHDLSDEIDKINGLGAIIAKCGKILKLPGQSRNYGRWAKKDTIGRRTLQKYIQVFESHENSGLIKDELRILNQAANSGVVWDEIKKIEVWSPEQTEYVYDFTVPGNQTFMTDYGIIIHNTLNTFHFAGVSSKSNVTRGVPRIEEILSLSSDPKNPSLTVFLKPEDEADREKAQSIMYMLEHTKMKEVVSSTEICFDPDDLNTLINDDESTMQQFRAFENMVDECMETSLMDDTNEKSKWILRMEMNPEVMLEKNITMDDVNFTLKNSFGDEISCVYSDYNSDKLVFRIRMNNVVKQGSNKGGAKKTKVNPLDQSDQIYLLKNFQDQLLENIVLRGIKRIKKVILRKIKDNVVEQAGVFKKKDIWVLDTIGTNMMDVLALDYIDPNRTFSNDIVEIYETFGIEAARQAIYNELADVIEFDGTYINFHHLSILCDRMTFTNKMISIFRHGINNDNIGPIAKASFEETPEMFLRAARHAELDTLRGVSANVMCGQEGLFGTNAFQVVLDLEEMRKLEEVAVYEKINEEESIEKLFGGVENPDDQCSSNKLTIQNNVVSIKSTDLGQDNTYNPGF
jgi:DNA-directed RNA polymerase II subunit RPB1